MQIQTIPLSQLKPHPRNVRKVGGTSIEDLAASIAAHGLLHPIVVSPMGNGFEVIAGARRLKAIEALAHGGCLPDSLADGVPCQVMAGGSVTELSLAENVIRQAMHPADEFEAYRALVDQGQSADEIASRFGVKVRHVEERLRLANVAPELLEVYRLGGATLEQIMALSVVDDHAAQLKAWGDESTQSWERRPDYLRDQLTDSVIVSGEGIAVFVGREAYIEAGGTIRPDLFSEIEVFEDGALVKRLATAKLKERADQLKCEGWGWVEAKLDWPHSERIQYRQMDAGKPAPLFGAIVTIGSSGKFEIHKGLLRPGDKAPKDAKPKTPGAGKSQATAKNPMGEVNARLEAVRLGALRAHLRAKPDAALAVLASAMAADYFNLRDEPGVDLAPFNVMPYKNPALRGVIEAVDADSQKADTLWRKRTENGAQQHGSVLAWLLAEPKHIAGLLEFLAVEIVDPAAYSDAERAKAATAISLTGVNLADHWQLTPEWLQAQGKDYMLAALKDALGDRKFEDGGWSKLKAALLPEQAHKALVAAGWLPAPMRAPEPKAAKKAAKATTNKGAKK